MYGSIAEPKNVFGEDLLPYFYEAMEYKAKGAMHLLELLRAAWNSDTLVHQWTLPDGYTAYVPVTEMQKKRISVTELDYCPEVNIEVNQEQEFGISLIANAVHSLDAFVLRSVIRRCNYNKPLLEQFMSMSHQVNFLPPKPSLKGVDKFYATGLADIKWIEYINHNNIYYYPMEMIQELRRICKMVLAYKPFEVVTIHDSFGCLAGNCNQLRFHYKEILAELSDSTVIDDILNQLYGNVDIIKKGKFISDKIRNSNYSLC